MEQPNMNYIKSLSGDDKSFEEKLFAIIKSEFPTEQQIYLNHIEAQNYQLTAEIVHKLKHKISILGLEKSYKIAVEFENNLLDESTELQEEFESILLIITNFLKQL